MQLYFSAAKGQCALPRVLLVPEMWNSTVTISSVCTEVRHRNFQNMNLFSLTKCAEGAGVRIVKVTADEVKPCVIAALDQLGSCQSPPPSASGKGAAGFPLCAQRKNLAQLRNHSIMCQKCCIFLSRFFQALQSFFLKIDAAFPFVFLFLFILCFASILSSSLPVFPIKPREM